MKKYSLFIIFLLCIPYYTTASSLQATNDLFNAIENNNISAFKYALSQGADVNAINPSNGNTPLITVVEKMVSKGVATFDEVPFSVSSALGGAIITFTTALVVIGSYVWATQNSYTYPEFPQILSALSSSAVIALIAGYKTGYLWPDDTRWHSYLITCSSYQIMFYGLITHSTIDIEKTSMRTNKNILTIINEACIRIPIPASHMVHYNTWDLNWVLSNTKDYMTYQISVNDDSYMIDQKTHEDLKERFYQLKQWVETSVIHKNCR